MWFHAQKSLLAQLKMSCGNVSLAQRVGRVRRRILPGKGLWSASDAQSCRSRSSQEASLTLGVFHIVLLSNWMLSKWICACGNFLKGGLWKHFALHHLIWLMNHVWGRTFCQNAKICKISIAVKEFPPLFLHNVKHNLVRWWLSGHHLSEWARIWPNFASCLAIL